MNSNINEYRIGSVVLHKHDHELDIVDGQQRLTTLSIIVYCLSGENDNKLLETDYSELSYKAIRENYQIINRCILGLNETKKKALLSYIEKKCTLVKIITHSEQEAFQFFDSQNSRGKALEPHDLLKSYHLREMIDTPEEKKISITYTSPKTMHWIHKLLKKLNENQEMDQVDFLEKYLATKVDESRIEDKERKEIDFERVVFTYLDYVLWRDNRNRFKEFQFQFRTSIEHFFPQHPLDGEPWDETKPLNDFGNLALLTVSANSKFSNLPPIAKIEKKEINQSPKLIIMKEITEKNKRWTENEVRSHGEEMLNLLKTELRHRLN